MRIDLSSKSNRSVERLKICDAYFYQELINRLRSDVAEQWIVTQVEALDYGLSGRSPSVHNPLRSSSSISAASTIFNSFKSKCNRDRLDDNQNELVSSGSSKVDSFFQQELEKRGVHCRQEEVTAPNVMDTQDHHVRCKKDQHYGVRRYPSFVGATSDTANTLAGPHQISVSASNSKNSFGEEDVLERCRSSLTRSSSLRQKISSEKMGLLFTDAAHTVFTQSFIKRASSQGLSEHSAL